MTIARTLFERLEKVNASLITTREHYKRENDKLDGKEASSIEKEADLNREELEAIRILEGQKVIIKKLARDFGVIKGLNEMIMEEGK